MPDRTEPTATSDPAGPPPQHTDKYCSEDHGQFWCINASGHPLVEGRGPDPDSHFPSDECQSLAGSFSEVRLGLDGRAVELELYAAAPYGFHEARPRGTIRPARIVFDCYSDDGREPADAMRISLPPGEALRLSRRIAQIVDLVSPIEPRN
jgi:hypothetical protein